MQRLKGETPHPGCDVVLRCAPKDETVRREATITALEKLGGEIALVF